MQESLRSCVKSCTVFVVVLYCRYCQYCRNVNIVVLSIRYATQTRCRILLHKHGAGFLNSCMVFVVLYCQYCHYYHYCSNGQYCLILSIRYAPQTRCKIFKILHGVCCRIVLSILSYCQYATLHKHSAGFLKSCMVFVVVLYCQYCRIVNTLRSTNTVKNPAPCLLSYCIVNIVNMDITIDNIDNKIRQQTRCRILHGAGIT